MSSPSPMATFKYLTLHALCGLLVIIFVNTYPLFRYIAENLGDTVILVGPVVLPVMLVVPFLFRIRCRQSGQQTAVSRPWLATGLLLSAVALFIPDAALAVKRIHVVEYLLLSLLVRFTMAQRISHNLLLYSALFTAGLGIHDEFLQGIHPQRTFGLRDILVNITAGVGGACFWHGLLLFSQNPHPGNGDKKGAMRVPYLCWLLGAVAALTIPTATYLNESQAYWPTLPLAATMILWAAILADDRSQQGHGIACISMLCFLLILYPVIVNVAHLSFF